MKEIIWKKVSIYKTSIEKHLTEIVNIYVKQHKDTFQKRKWDCSINTSTQINILFENEFKYIREAIEKEIDNLLKNNFGKSMPFMIINSWINVMEKYGYQEFHNHNNNCYSGVLYISEHNSNIEFAIFPENTTKQITPEKGDILLFDGSTYHRVVDSGKERISLAFNFVIDNDS